MIVATGCNLQNDMRFTNEGVGSNLYSTDVQRQYRIQQLYYGYLCGQASLPLAGISPEGVPVCDFPVFGTLQWNTLVQAGMNDIDTRCDAYLAWYDSRKRSQRPLISQINTTGRLVNAILLASSPSAATIGVVAEAFGFAAATVNNYHSRLLYEIDTSTLQALVLDNQRTFREGIVDLKFQTKPAVEHALRSYLRICMPFSIETEVNTVLTSVKRTGEPPPPLIGTGTVEAAVDATKPRTAEQRVTVVRVTPPPVIPESPEVRKIFSVPNYGPSDLVNLQKALCVPPDEIGKVGARTRIGFAIFETYVAGQPNIRKDGKVSSDDEFARAVKFEPCDTAKYRNIFEAEQIGRPSDVDLLAGALRDANVPVAGDPAAAVSDLNALRTSIAVANRQLGIAGTDGAAPDEATPALYRKLGILIQRK
ncbi:MAG TPA: hypothetical protein VIZ90_20235 [Rhizobiaceae bacterium]